MAGTDALGHPTWADTDPVNLAVDLTAAANHRLHGMDRVGSLAERDAAANLVVGTRWRIPTTSEVFEWSGSAWEVLHAHGAYTHTNEDWAVQFSTLVRDRDEVRFSLKLTGVRQVTWSATKRVLGTIPASFAPSAILFAPVLVRAGTNWFAENFEVRPSGEVVLDQQAQFTLGGTSQMHASVIFKTA